jgi:hypothetical protein
MTKTISRSSQYEGVALINDPVHGYISFTVPYPDQPKEVTEKDIIDSGWGQRSGSALIFVITSFSLPGTHVAKM